MDRDRLAQLTMDAVASAVEGNAERASDAMTAIGTSGDPFDMYAACCAFADVAKRAMVKATGTEPNLAAGDMWAIVDLTPDQDHDPAETFAVRFLIAYANDDRETPPALYRAALEAGPDHFIASTCALLSNAAGLHRMAMSLP